MDSHRRRTTPLVDQQIPEQAKAFCIAAQDVIKNVMQSLIVSQGSFME